MSTPDAQPSRLLPRRPQGTIPPSSLPSTPLSNAPDASASVANPASNPGTPPLMSLPMRPPTPAPNSAQLEHEHALDFATHSWDLKTGGLKTLTAKRELPTRLDRRSAEVVQGFHESPSTRSYMFAMIVLVCVIFMLIGGGVILFVILQP